MRANEAFLGTIPTERGCARLSIGIVFVAIDFKLVNRGGNVHCVLWPFPFVIFSKAAL